MPLITIVLVVVALVVLFASTIWNLVLAFQRKWVWGVVLLVSLVVATFLPKAIGGSGNPSLQPVVWGAQLLYLALWIAFLIVAWPKAKQPFFWYLTGLVLLVMAFFTIPNGTLAFSTLKNGASAGDPQVVEKLRALVADGVGKVQETTSKASQPSSTPPPVFQSRLPAPPPNSTEPESPQPGIYYLAERVTASTKTGIKAGNPGERVILQRRLPGDRMVVMLGSIDFEVRGSQVTDDIAMARELERKDFQARGGKL